MKQKKLFQIMSFTVVVGSCLQMCVADMLGRCHLHIFVGHSLATLSLLSQKGFLGVLRLQHEPGFDGLCRHILGLCQP